MFKIFFAKVVNLQKKIMFSKKTYFLREENYIF